MSTEWYRDWFNRDYLSVYAHRDLEEAALQVELLCKHIKPEAGKHYLDLCCGTGRYTALLNKRGFSIRGLDLSEALLEKARGFDDDLEFIQGDMRKINGQYDGIFSFFTSFGYFTHSENMQTLEGIYQALKTGGKYWLDFFNADREVNSLPAECTKKTPHLKIKERKYLKDKRVIKKIDIKTPHGEERKYRESVSFYAPDELQDMLKHCGFNILSIFGSYQGQALDINSPRCIILAEKT